MDLLSKPASASVLVVSASHFGRSGPAKPTLCVAWDVTVEMFAEVQSPDPNAASHFFASSLKGRARQRKTCVSSRKAYIDSATRVQSVL